MARHEIITDDITGEANASQVYISIDDSAWTIDLAKGSRSKLKKALAPFLSKATPVTAASTRTTAASPRSAVKPARAATSKRAAARGKSDAVRRGQIRAWAADNEVEIPSRGRIPRAVIEQYDAAVG